MKKPIDKTQENKSQSSTKELTQNQLGHTPTTQLVDNRPETIAQRKLQDLANNSEQTKLTAQLAAIAQNSSKQEQAIQQVENKTGLPDNLKAGIENLSGYSMNDVKVHYNSAKPAQLQAHAYAQGTDIHLAPKQEKHLPHEAWHVVQQKQRRVKPTMQLKGKVNVNDDAGLEREADMMGAKANQMQRIPNSAKVLQAVVNTSNIIQPKYEGTTDVSASSVKELIELLIEIKYINLSASSPRHAKVLELVAMENKTHDTSSIMDIIEKIEETIEEVHVKETSDENRLIRAIREKFKVAPPKATILWTGGNLPVRGIEKYKKAVVKAFKTSSFNDEVASKVAEEFGRHEMEKAMIKGRVHQQLDQEIEFCENVQLVERQLAKVGIESLVYRPTNEQFLHPTLDFIPEYWTPFDSIEKIESDPADKNILVTMGHGNEKGATQFGADGVLTQAEIAKNLNITDLGSAMLYIPLQCYPQQAVKQAKEEMGWTSASVASEKTISSGNIVFWLNKMLFQEIAKWLE